MSTRSSRWRKYRPVIALSILSMLVCGLAYPLLITGVAQAALPYQADGSQAQLGGRAVGSYYIDNGFTLPAFFHGRNETNPLTASASGVDPDITVAEALSQVPRISNTTGIAGSSLVALVMSHEHWTLWVTGTPYVNVLELNLALIAAYPSSYPGYA
ncbi:MAG: potassium-transporting ATPase subunit C [Nitrososphaerota archaeon]|jgi:K+-transporting ATPase ATPase C chain|nr:potassium-transporting ATPase subunit C [Nitrososphaerota archaeon]MDG6955540.1 potassium-transporting ATPase subunit C [Nitrososphaerota archaeon]